jgi:hypothetical protein
MHRDMPPLCHAFHDVLPNYVPGPVYLSCIVLRSCGIPEKDWLQYFDRAFEGNGKVLPRTGHEGPEGE